jgi:hypothetical protein
MMDNLINCIREIQVSKYFNSEKISMNQKTLNKLREENTIFKIYNTSGEVVKLLDMEVKIDNTLKNEIVIYENDLNVYTRIKLK